MARSEAETLEPPKSKRKNGWHKGYIEALPSGSLRWSVRVQYPDGTKERRRGTVRTKTEAQKAIVKAQMDAQVGLRPVSETLTVGEMVLEFMEAKKQTWAEKTTFNNEKLYARHIAPELADLKAAGVDPRRLRAYFQWLSTKRPRSDGKGYFAPLAFSGQRQIHVLLSGAYKRAIADGLLRENPAQHARPISPSKTVRSGRDEAGPCATRKQKYFTPEELIRFIEEARSGRDRSAYVLAFMGLTGLRIGEALALTWEDFREDPKALGTYYVDINKTRNELGSEYKTTAPKTASSIRPVYLSGEAIGILQEMQRRIMVESSAENYRGQGLALTAPIFPAVDGRHMRQDVARAVMRRTCEAAGVPLYSPHALRHSVGTYYIADGVDPVTVAKHLGHAQVSTTLNIYAHALPSKLRGMGLDVARLTGQTARTKPLIGAEESTQQAVPSHSSDQTVRQRGPGLRPKKLVRRR